MNERTCPSCGAQSAADAAYCWQCYARFGGPAGPRPETSGASVGPLAAALGRGPGAGTPAAVVSEPATITRWKPSHGSRSEARWVVRGLFLVLAVVGGYFGYRWLFTGFPFPDQIAGVERLDSDQTESLEDMLRSFADMLDAKFQLAVYGSVLAPDYVMYAFEVPDPESMQELLTDLGVDTGGVPSGAVEAVLENLPFTCQPLSPTGGAQCFWSDDRLIVGLQDFQGTPEELDPIARQVRADTA